MKLINGYDDGSIKESLTVGVLQPFYFRKDDDGHEFLIPKSELNEFEKWVKLDTDSDAFYEHHGFEHYMINSIYDEELWLKMK